MKKRSLWRYTIGGFPIYKKPPASDLAEIQKKGEKSGSGLLRETQVHHSCCQRKERHY